MRLLRLIGVALLVVFAMCAVAASGAQADSAPFFSIGGTRLAAGKTHNISGHGIRPFELFTPANGSDITCGKLTVEKGVLSGSEPGTQGKTDQTSKFEGCRLESGKGAPRCHLAASEGGSETSTTITMNPLHGELVENVEGGKGGKKLEELYTPASGTVLVTLFYGGEGCEVVVEKWTGSTAAEVVTDPGEASIELPGPTPENTSFILRWPATAITEVWLVSGGIGKIVKVGERRGVFEDNGLRLGTVLELLANKNFEPENVKWSPLP